MIEAALTALGETWFAELLRASRYLYPVVNGAHILALATLFGSIAAFDLRVLGLFKTVPVAPLAKMLPRVAATGLALALVTGVLLFSVDPVVYANNPAFRIKLVLVTLATLHAIAVHRSAAWRKLARTRMGIDWRMRASAAMSLVLWTAAIMAGRFIAFI